MYLTRKLKLGRSGQLDALARRAGRLWSTVAKWHWRFVRRQGYWLSKGQAQTMYCKGYGGLHSQSAQAVADSFYDSLRSWRKKRMKGRYEGLRPPYKQKRYFKIQWKSSAIRLRDDGVLRLSNGRGNDPVLINWPSEAIASGQGRNELRSAGTEISMSFAASTKSKRTKSRKATRPLALTSGRFTLPPSTLAASHGPSMEESFAACVVSRIARKRVSPRRSPARSAAVGAAGGSSGRRTGTSRRFGTRSRISCTSSPRG